MRVQRLSVKLVTLAQLAALSVSLAPSPVSLKSGIDNTSTGWWISWIWN